MSPGKFAISYTVKNEARLLPSAIEYHLAAGCSRIYIFWDGTSDGSESLVAKYPCVVARNSMKPDEIHDPPAWMARIHPWWETNMDVRKNTNSYCAAQDAAADGIEWFIAIDPDELILMSRDEQVIDDHISKHLSKIPDHIDQVHLPNVESFPTSADSENPFADCVCFLNRFPATEFVWKYSRALLNRVSRSPQLVAWYDYFFYQLRFPGALPRLMREPRTLSRIPAGYFLGYSNHKSFVRARESCNFAFAVHSWMHYKKTPRSMKAGNILHFDMLDAGYFISKFRQRQQGIILKAFYLRYRLANLVRNSTDNEIREFFEQYIAMRDPKQVANLIKRGIVIEIHAASNFMKRRQEASTHAGK